MGIPKRYTVLGCKLNAPAARWAAQYKKDFLGLGGYPPGWNPQRVREDDIITCLGMLALHHLGYKIPVESAEWLGRGFDVVVDYFCGDWWRGHPDAARAMDKARKRRELRWFNAFSIGLLLGLLSERWEDVAAICDWVEPGLKAEPLLVDTEEVELDLSHVYLSVAASFRSNPMIGLTALEKQLRASKNPRPRFLFQAWEAARAGNQTVFEEAFVMSLAHFTALAGSGPTPIHWVATHQSVIGLAAMRLGVALPRLPQKLDALVITRASLGLDATPTPSGSPTGARATRSRAKSRTGYSGDEGEPPVPEVSPEYVSSLIEQFKAGHRETEEISARQLTYTLRGLMRAKAQLVSEGKPLNRDSVEAWFIKNTSIEGHFENHDQFVRCIDFALKILQAQK